MRNVYKILARKLEEKRQLGRPRRKWEDGIRVVLRETVWENVGWNRLVQDH
jgi:hypothetical protein